MASGLKKWQKEVLGASEKLYSGAEPWVYDHSPGQSVHRPMHFTKEFPWAFHLLWVIDLLKTLFLFSMVPWSNTFRRIDRVGQGKTGPSASSQRKHPIKNWHSPNEKRAQSQHSLENNRQQTKHICHLSVSRFGFGKLRKRHSSRKRIPDGICQSMLNHPLFRHSNLSIF